MELRKLRAPMAIVAAAALVAMMAMMTPAAAKGPTPKTIRFALSSYTAYEGQSPGYASIEITRSVKTKTPSITVKSGGGQTTATDGVDYTAVDQVVTFPRNVTSVTIQVPILVEKEPGEGDEKVEFTLSNPSTGWSLVSGPYTKTWLTIKEMPLPPTPTLSAPVVNGPTSISLSWTIPADSPDGYKWIFAVFKSTDGGSTEAEMTRGDGLYGLPVTGLTANTQYWFEVRGLNDDGAWSAAGSGWQTATTAALTPPKPTITYTNPSNKAELQWTIGAFTDPVTFELYRSTVSGFTPGSGTLVSDQIASSTWTDCAVIPNVPSTYGCPLTLGTTYYYLVRAVSAAGAGPYSDEEPITPESS